MFCVVVLQRRNDKVQEDEMNYKSIQRAVDLIVEEPSFDEHLDSMKHGLLDWSKEYFTDYFAIKAVNLSQLRCKRMFSKEEYKQALNYARRLIA